MTPESPYPYCIRFHTAIVDEFPPGCPLAGPNPLDTQLELKNEMFRRFDQHDFEGGAALGRANDVCNAYFDELNPHPHVQRLRRELST